MAPSSKQPEENSSPHQDKDQPVVILYEMNKEKLTTAMEAEVSRESLTIEKNCHDNVS